MRDDAWGWLSKYVRLKDADPDGFSTCYTCERKYFWKELDCGHYNHGHNKPSYLEENNVRPQCFSCNQPKSGVLDVYSLKLIDEIGREAVDELVRLSHEVKKLDRDYYQLKIDTYKQFYEALVSQRLSKGETV